METITSNPQDIQDLAAKFQNPTVEVKTVAPESLEVELPGGFLKKDGSVVKFASVKELTGADEEVIYRSASTGLFLNTILSRGIDTIGYEKATAADLDTMLAGDRDTLLLAIRRATFGNKVDGETTCPACGERQDVLIDLVEDVEVRELPNPIVDRIFDVDAKIGKVTVGLPNGLTQKRLMESTNKNSAELTTLLLGSCIISINDEPSLGASTAAKLGILDREKLITEIVRRNPGPRLEAVVKACKACGTEMSLPLSLADLFRL